MRKIRIMEHMSLDGFIQAGRPGEYDEDYANGGWTVPYRNPVGLEAVLEAQGKKFDLLLGRRTYDLWSSYWPKIKDGPFAPQLNAATKYVATHRPDSLSWGPVKDLGKDIVKGVRDLKSTDGPDLILWGSSMLAPVLLGQGLVDDVVLILYPLLLARGIRFFSNSADPCELALVSSKATPTGGLINTYRYVGPLRTQSSSAST